MVSLKASNMTALKRAFEIQTTPQSKRVIRKHHRKISVRGQLYLLTIVLKHTKKPKGHERLLPFVTTYHLAVKNFKQMLMERWSLIHNQPSLETNFTKPPIIFYKDMFLRAKWKPRILTKDVCKWKRRKIERNKRSSQSKHKAKLTDPSGW